jgi:hypothetical protein
LKNGNLLRQRKNPDRLCMRNTLRALDFFASLHLTIFEQAANFELFGQSVSAAGLCRPLPFPACAWPGRKHTINTQRLFS